MKGWLISSSPNTNPGDTTPWYASFWSFCSLYCTERFGKLWHLSPEQSLLLAGENTIIPDQVIVSTPKGTNNTIELPFTTSLYDLVEKRMPPESDLMFRDGLRIFTPEAALTRVPESFFHRHTVEAGTALTGVNDASNLLRRLLDGGHTAIAGRLAGAFRHIGRAQVADDILSTMKAAGYDIRESDPFQTQQPFGTRTQGATRSTTKTIAAIDLFPGTTGLAGRSQGISAIRHRQLPE
jgi:hypothetical protein